MAKAKTLNGGIEPGRDYYKISALCVAMFVVIKLFGRDFGHAIGEFLRTLSVGVAGAIAAFVGKMHQDTVFFGNLSALCAAMFVVIKMINVLFDIYYQGKTREMLEQEERIQKEKEQLEEERLANQILINRIDALTNDDKD